MALLGLILVGLKRQKRTTFHHNHNKQISVTAYGRNVNSRMTTYCHLELLVRQPLRERFLAHRIARLCSIMMFYRLRSVILLMGNLTATFCLCAVRLEVPDRQAICNIMSKPGSNAESLFSVVSFFHTLITSTKEVMLSLASLFVCLLEGLRKKNCSVDFHKISMEN